MMNYPPLNELQAKAGCRYLLVTTVAKRARQLQDDPESWTTASRYRWR